jgi:hypothetical protein
MSRNRNMTARAILALAPGAQFVMVEGAITEWHTPDIPQPTEEEIAAKMVELQNPVPAVVSRFQARAALHTAGLLEQVEAAVASAGPLAQMAWADAVEFRRDSPTIAALAAEIGLSSAQIDDLFRTAAQIQA